MNRRFEDELLKHAFGELDAREAAHVEEKISSDLEAKRKLQEFSSLRGGLSLLKDVPPDQMSTERLRDAILGQGLKPLPPKTSNGWGWTWMPVTAFAVAFAFVAFHRNSGKTPQFIQGPTASVAHKTEGFLRTPVPSTVAARVVPVPPRLVSTATPSVHAKSEPKHQDAPVSLKHDTATLVAYKAPTPAVDKKVPDATVVNGTTADSNSGPVKLVNANSSIVMINPEKDNDTGAQKATEVDSASNVVVGG